MNPIEVTITLDMEQLKYMLNNNNLGIKDYVDEKFEHGELGERSVVFSKRYYGVPFTITLDAPFQTYKNEGN